MRCGVYWPLAQVFWTESFIIVIQVLPCIITIQSLLYAPLHGRQQNKSQEEVMQCGAFISMGKSLTFCQADAGHLLWVGCAVCSVSSSVTSSALYGEIKVLHVEDLFAGQGASVKASWSWIFTNKWMNAVPLINVFLFVLVNPCLSFSISPCLNIALEFFCIKLLGGKVVVETWRVEITLTSFHKPFVRGQGQNLGL